MERPGCPGAFLKMEGILIMNIEAEWVNLSINTTINSDFDIIDGKGEIFYYNEDDTYESLGYITFSVINQSLINKNDFIYIFDITGDHMVLYSHIEEYLKGDKDDIEGLLFGSLVTFNEININKSYRNKGIGKKIMQDFIKWSEIMDLGCIMLNALAYEANEENKFSDSRRLKKFYQDVGFSTLVEDKEEKSYIMYYDLTRQRNSI